MRKLACLLLAVSLLLGEIPAGAEESVAPSSEETPAVTTNEPTQEQDETPLPPETQEPEPSATPLPPETQAPDDTQSPEPADNTEAPEPTPTPEPEWDEAWIRVGEEQTIVCGKLFDFVQALEEKTEIFLRTDEIIKLEEVSVQKLLLADLLLDEDYFQGNRWILCVSEDDPLAAEPPEAFRPEDYEDAKPEDVITVYVWAALLPDETATPSPDDPVTPSPDESVTPNPDESVTPNPDESVTPSPDESVTPNPDESATPDPSQGLLIVEAENYVADAWSGQVPVFRLSGIPEGGEGYSYAVIVLDKSFVVLSGDTYAAEEQGEYTVRLALLDEMGDIVSASENYLLRLDYTMPVLSVESDMSVPYTAHLVASDGESGLEGISLDGGETWQAMPEEGVYTLTAQEKTTYPAGAIQARDLAGNVTVWEQEVVLDTFHWGGGGGGGGDGKKPQPHAPATTTSDAAYNAVGLKLSEEPMHTLVMEGEELELTLDVTEAKDLALQEEEPALFTQSLDSWTVRLLDEEGNEQIVRDGEHPDVLVLSALADEQTDQYTLEWKINGAALRTLYNSGINYLALRAGKDLVTMPTEGFMAGTRYASLKMAGVSTRKFNYTLRMQVDHSPKDGKQETTDVQDAPERPAWLFTDTCQVSIRVEVEGETWELPIGEESEMYVQDVYCGPVALLEVPYGEYKEEDEQ